MGTPGSAPDVTRDDVRDLYGRLDRPSTPISAAGVAGKLECSRRTAEQRLADLEDRGELASTVVEGGPRVWWRPDDGGEVLDRDRNREELTALIDAVEDYAVSVLDPDGVVVDWNGGAGRLEGYASDDVVGEHVSTFYTEADVEDGVPERTLETAAAEGCVENEGWRVRADGSRFWASVTVTAVRDDDGELQGFTEVTRDVTDRREYERQLRRERDLVEQIVETVPVSICLVSSDGQFVHANQRMVDWLGISESDVADYCLDNWAVYDADEQPIPEDELPWVRVAERGASVRGFECRADVPNVGRRWLSIDAAPLEDTPRGNERIVVSVDDVTEQKYRQRHLRREYNQTEKLLRTAPVAIAVQNADRETILANERAQEAFGLSEQELKQNPVDEGDWAVCDADGDPLPPDETPSAKVLATGEPVFNQGIIMEPSDGDPMQFRVNAAPLLGEDGEVERVVTAGEEITELKRRERQLERQKTELETELSEILGRISDAFCALDAEWRFTHLNERAADVMRRSREELRGRVLWDVLADDAGDAFRERFHEAMDTQEPVSFEVSTEEPDAWLEVNAYPSETGLSVYFRDVTERIERERELIRYETIVETINDGIYVKDDDGRFTMVNDAYAELTGYDREELLGEHASLVVDEDAIDQSRAIRAAADGEDELNPSMEASILRADGSTVPAEGTLSTYTTDEGDRKQVGVVRDISERKERERRLEESERRYRTLAENFPNGAVVVYDQDLRFTLAKGSVLGGTLPTAERLEGARMPDVVPDDTVADLEPVFRAAVEDGETGRTTTEFGGRNWRVWATPLRDADGEIFAGMGLAQDITEQVERERRLQTLVDQLEESNERLEQFAYAASHDLQEPLRMVSSYLQLIERRYADAFDEDGREFLTFAVDGADRMREMIEGLLKYSRVDTRGDPLERVDLDDVVADVRADLQFKIEESGAEIDAGSLPAVEGDADQLRQLFQNLIDNAIEYSGDAPPSVEISAERDVDRWRIAVSDDGIGIDPAETDRIFEVFERLHTADEHDGTGIGLALCKRIVERHGGDLWVESEPGEGSTFALTLPAVDAAAGSDAESDPR
ncbi:PAS domain-containing sensor histidine kinase [Halomicrobium urmianum]|uniref:PAS domain-containing sensor histidine kinase n=1 Tax=Halomicrobium urmianum TaxID=1586233 RepID=UPI001CD9C422|nr:PAS domain S-box protein [Halomicrobium urmianum]